jgi:hypothetical protein
MKIQLVLNFMLVTLILDLTYFKEIRSVLRTVLYVISIIFSFVVLIFYLKHFFTKILPYILFVLLFLNILLILTGLSFNYFYFSNFNTLEIILNLSEILILTSFSFLIFKSIINSRNKTESILKRFTKLYSLIEFIFYVLVILFFIFVFLKNIVYL